MFLVKEEPLYLRLKSNLKRLIESQNLTILPGTRELEKNYGVSRITVRRAIAELAKEGVVTSMQGRKVMVTKHMYSSVKELGFVTSELSGWGEYIFSDFAKKALSANCNFNMFICGAAGHITENTSFNYLLDSNKLSALLMMSRLPAKDIEYILRKKIPLLTYDFKYKNYDIPAALFSYQSAFSQMIDYYLQQNVNRFGFISFYEEGNDPACGKSRVFIDDYKKIIGKHKLLDYNIPILFKMESNHDKAALSAIKHLHALDPKERPQVILTSVHGESRIVKSYLEQIDDWEPFHIYYRLEQDGIPRFVYPYKKLVEASFENLVKRINNSGYATNDTLIPIAFDWANK